MLLRYPVVVGWLNGHTHLNQILAHARPDGGGLWEITTASCIDSPAISDAVLEAQELAQRARLLAHERGLPG